MQGLCRTGSAPHWLLCSGELSSPFTSSSTQKSKPCTLPRQHNGPDPRGKGTVQVSGPSGYECGRDGPPLICHEVEWVHVWEESRGAEVDALLWPQPSVVGRAGPEATRARNPAMIFTS